MVSMLGHGIAHVRERSSPDCGEKRNGNEVSGHCCSDTIAGDMGLER